MKQFGSIFIAFTVVAFGAISLGSAFTHTYSQLIVTRVLLGIAEGGTLVWPANLIVENAANRTCAVGPCVSSCQVLQASRARPPYRYLLRSRPYLGWSL